MPDNTDWSSSKDETAKIYHELKNGGGHERVNEQNVQTLIAMAAQYGDAELETQLREWQVTCGDDNASPPSRAFPPSSLANDGRGGRQQR